MTQEATERQFALCIRNEGCEDLEKRRVYQVLADGEAATAGYIGVVDESGEDYLYPESHFVRIQVPPRHRKRSGQAADLRAIRQQELILERRRFR